MIAQYFIKVVIPLVFSALVAGLGWFANEEIGAVVAGICSLIVSAIWTCYSWTTGSTNIAQAHASHQRKANSAKRGRAAYKYKLQN